MMRKIVAICALTSVIALSLTILALSLQTSERSNDTLEPNAPHSRQKRSIGDVLRARAKDTISCERKERRRLVERKMRDVNEAGMRRPVHAHRNINRAQSYIRTLLNQSAEVMDMVDCIADSLPRTRERDSMMKEISTISIKDTPLGHACQPKIEFCDPDQKYRTIDGSCNNLANPWWGMTGTLQERLLKPWYGNGISSPRTHSHVERAYRLPSPRVLTVSMLRDSDVPSKKFNAMVPFFGQFLDHDLTSTPAAIPTEGEGSGEMLCCSKDPQLLHPECFPIEIPKSDPFYKKHGTECMDFVRSAATMDLYGCRLGTREQMNQVTSYLDGSNVYGSSKEIETHLRSFTNGLLSVSRDPLDYHGGLLPLDEDRNIGPCLKEFGLDCFAAGDFRVNEQDGLTCMHAMWVREHNRIAEKMRKVHPQWDDEKLYQETRRIVVAELQAVAYQEWLPRVLGPEWMDRFFLNSRNSRYRSDMNAAIVNSFSTAAFRFGHSLLNANYITAAKDNDWKTELVPLRHMFNGIVFQHMGYMDRFVRGALRQPAQTVDNNVPKDITNHLFQEPEGEEGLDLAALNMQRGRDHGLPGYAKFWELCSGQQMTWELLEETLQKSSEFNIVETLKQQYTFVEDIDLWLGGINEKPVPGGIVGSTFACIIGQQFYKLKYGDRFFFEHSHEVGSFTNQQLEELRKTTISRVICRNSKTIRSLSKYAFELESNENPSVDCEELPDLDLTYWRN